MKHLYRSKKNRILLGVAGGIAEYLEVDPVLIRLIFIILFFAPPALGLWLYLAGWVLIPEEGEVEEEKEEQKKETRESKTSESEIIKNIKEFFFSFKNHSSRVKRGRIIFGIFLVVLGILLFLNRYFAILSKEIFWPILLILIGLIILIREK